MGYNIKYLISLNLLLTMASCRAFIYDIRVMRKWDSAKNQYCYFIGLGDFHDKRHSITPLQVNQIDHIVSKCDAKKTKLIVEDIASKNNTGQRCCGRFFVTIHGKPKLIASSKAIDNPSLIED